MGEKSLHSNSLPPTWYDNTKTDKTLIHWSTFPEWLQEGTEFGPVRNTKMNETEALLSRV